MNCSRYDRKSAQASLLSRSPALVQRRLELIAGGEESMLETLMAEIPKDAARIVVANEITPEVEALIERYARRARRVAPPTADATPDSPARTSSALPPQQTSTPTRAHR